MSRSAQKITQAPCKNCNGWTNHRLIATDVEEEQDKEHFIYCCNLNEMLKCLGCNSVVLRHTYRDQDDEDATFHYYPPPSSWRIPHWISNHFPFSGQNVPYSIRTMMKEVYTALENGSLRLAAMGIRATIENLMIEKIGDQQSFKANVDALQKAGYLSLRQAVALDSVLEAGHAAIHRQWEPKHRDIHTVLKLANKLIETVYLDEKQVRDLDKNVPKRPRPAPAAT